MKEEELENTNCMGDETVSVQDPTSVVDENTTETETKVEETTSTETTDVTSEGSEEAPTDATGGESEKQPCDSHNSWLKEKEAPLFRSL